jgi:integrase
MFNTGARVQEVLNLQRLDVRLDAPCQVHLHGAGSKVQLCPIWPATARLLRELIGESRSVEPDPADALLFTNMRGWQIDAVRGPLPPPEVQRRRVAVRDDAA